MKLNKLLSATLASLLIVLFVNIFNKQDVGVIQSSDDNQAYIYNNADKSGDDLINDYTLLFSCVDNPQTDCLQKNFNQNHVFARKCQQDKSYNLKDSFFEKTIDKIAGISRFRLSFAALQSKHVLCYTLLFCRILT
ncbi:hypothetical protein LJC25_04030 [Bacteroidales bacterium OttesenSCG-928-K03]|nr:hypothetical protein [Bacteroidales bacterium OttesenSCG-928-L14]MDL2240314.1 hypothetical protein [Bacteroidales bacterium OttesenSCG-928-K22]MDL2242878.1 hypothetical protein [Bacteroidales bacterium OttesenSCG-928-K03]